MKLFAIVPKNNKRATKKKTSRERARIDQFRSFFAIWLKLHSFYSTDYGHRAQ